MSPPLVPAAALPGWPGHCTCPPHRTADRSCLGGGRGGGGGLVGGWVSWWLVVGLVEGWVGKPTGMPDSPHSSPDFNQPASNSCETYFPSSLHPPPALYPLLFSPHSCPPTCGHQECLLPACGPLPTTHHHGTTLITLHGKHLTSRLKQLERRGARGGGRGSWDACSSSRRVGSSCISGRSAT